MTAYLALLLGLAFAAGGGELFVKGSVGMARAARVSPGVIAATVAAFATSSPELTVAISSAMAGAPEISFGDALGSNVANVALILAIAILMAPITASRASLTRDFPVALLEPVVLGFLLLDGQISRVDGAILLAGFAAWLFTVVHDARGQRAAAPVGALGEKRPYRAVAETVIGLAFLIAAGKLIVFGASDIAKDFGLSEFVIGATIVALGTSTPELATVVISRLRGHDEVGLGAILGSNIFNGLFIVGVAAAITPINTPLPSAAPALVLGFAAVALTYPTRYGVIARWRGGMLLALYAAYLTAIIHMR